MVGFCVQKTYFLFAIRVPKIILNVCDSNDDMLMPLGNKVTNIHRVTTSGQKRRHGRIEGGDFFTGKVNATPAIREQRSQLQQMR